MKKIFTLLFLSFFYFLSVAQFKLIAEGPVFEEPETGYNKIVQLKNGYTAFIHIATKDGIDLKIYDPAHAQKVVKHIDPAYGKLKSGSVESVFEINGDIILMISEVDDKVPVLYRLIIDGKAGTLKEEKKIAELKKVNLGQGYAALFGNVPIPDFFIRKDPASDNYALSMFNSFASDRNKRIEIVHYGADHKELSRAYYSSPDNKFKYMNYIDMAVIGKEKVSVLAFAYNTASSGGKESELVLANLNQGVKEVTLDELKFSQDKTIDYGIVRFNPVTKKIILLAAAKAKKKGTFYETLYETIIAYVDPFSRKLEKIVSPYPKQANEKNIELFGKKATYKGMPQNLFINTDGSFSVVYEEITIISYNRVVNTSLENIAVSLFNAEGNESQSYLIPKSHGLSNTALNPLYHSVREGTAHYSHQGNQFKSFAYLSGSDKNYVLFNDIERNAESQMKGKITTISGVGECDGFYFNIAGNNVLPQRQFVFGKPQGKGDHNLGLFAISDYNKESNVYVTLKLEKEGRSKGVRVVWLQPQ